METCYYASMIQSMLYCRAVEAAMKLLCIRTSARVGQFHESEDSKNSRNYETVMSIYVYLDNLEPE